jgi:CRISPR/Cas system Type II protein with McrA/HNH and RuvC-like nuclease domain
MVYVPDKALPLNALTIDHIIPKKHNGSDSIDNLVAACFDCNQKRGDLLVWNGIAILEIVKEFPMVWKEYAQQFGRPCKEPTRRDMTNYA